MGRDKRQHLEKTGTLPCLSLGSVCVNVRVASVSAALQSTRLAQQQLATRKLRHYWRVSFDMSAVAAVCDGQ